MNGRMYTILSRYYRSFPINLDLIAKIISEILTNLWDKY